VCLLDFDFQMGSVATYLDLPRREAVYDMLSDTSMLDGDTLMQSMLTYHDRLQVLTAPAEMLPLDIVTSEDINRLIDVARDNFDFVVIDMPSAVVQWTEAVLNQAHIYFVPIELDMRSAQNTLRMIRALKSEELPVEKLRYVLNRAPKFTDLAAKGRVRRLAESLDITIELQFPDGGRQVTQANDHGLPLAPNSRNRDERNRHARQLHLVRTDDARRRRRAAAGPPRHAVPGELLLHARGEPGDDRVGVEVDARRLEDHRGLPQPAADEAERVLVRPAAAEGLHELLLGRHPVAFGVDEGAVHVPEDGGGEASGHNPQVYGHGLLWRCPGSTGRKAGHQE